MNPMNADHYIVTAAVRGWNLKALVMPRLNSYINYQDGKPV
jgi:hypothetical protein